MSAQPVLTYVVIYAKNLAAIAAFYEGTLLLERTEVEPTHILLSGGGTEVRRRDVKVKLPVGVKDGQRIKISQRGAAGRNGGPAGDLYVVVHVRPHPVFGRRGTRDLNVHVPITFAEAALGANVSVPTLEDPVTLKVKAGTQPGTTQKVKGRGIAGANGHAGDLYVTFDLTVPHKLDREQREAVEAVAAAFPDDPRAEIGVT